MLSLPAHALQASQPPAAPLAPGDYSTLTVNELRGMLKDRDLNPFGAKGQLLERLKASDTGGTASPMVMESVSTGAAKKKRKRT